MTVQAFDSFDDMQKAMSEAEDRANASLRPAQIALRDDLDNAHYWVSPAPDCLAFGWTYSFKEMCEASAKYVPDIPADDASAIVKADYAEGLDEARYEIVVAIDSRKRGYLRGVTYTIYDPKGDYHDAHVASVMPISKEAFEEARAAGWRAVDVPPLDLLLMGEEAARKGGWTPTLVKELRAIMEDQ
jgi:hypothetical protein